MPFSVYAQRERVVTGKCQPQTDDDECHNPARSHDRPALSRILQAHHPPPQRVSWLSLLQIGNAVSDCVLRKFGNAVDAELLPNGSAVCVHGLVAETQFERNLFH